MSSLYAPLALSACISQFNPLVNQFNLLNALVFLFICKSCQLATKRTRKYVGPRPISHMNKKNDDIKMK